MNKHSSTSVCRELLGRAAAAVAAPKPTAEWPYTGQMYCQPPSGGVDADAGTSSTAVVASPACRRAMGSSRWIMLTPLRRAPPWLPGCRRGVEEPDGDDPASTPEAPILRGVEVADTDRGTPPRPVRSRPLVPTPARGVEPDELPVVLPAATAAASKRVTASAADVKEDATPVPSPPPARIRLGAGDIRVALAASPID